MISDGVWGTEQLVILGVVVTLKLYSTTPTQDNCYSDYFIQRLFFSVLLLTVDVYFSL